MEIWSPPRTFTTSLVLPLPPKLSENLISPLAVFPKAKVEPALVPSRSKEQCRKRTEELLRVPLEQSRTIAVVFF